MDKAKHIQAKLKATTMRLMRAGADRSKPLSHAQYPFKQKFAMFVQRFIQRYTRSEISTRAASVTYYGVLSMFPIFITVGNLLPVFGLRYEVILKYLRQVIPTNIVDWLDPIIRGLLDGSHGGVLSIGALATMWTASMAINEMRNSFNRIYRVRSQQNFILQRFLVMLVMIIVIGLLAGVLVAFTFGSQFLDWLGPKIGMNVHWLDVFNAWRWPVTIAAMLLAVGGMDFYLPNARIKFRTVLPGTLFTSATWIMLAQLFSYYMRYFGTKYSSYGTVGSVMVLMLWLNFAATFLLIGVVLNAELAEFYYGRAVDSRGRFRDWMDRRRGN
ncbi:YihY/virulence factor BrkB family protein [Lacticaseibacillus pabuli]|uniref:YihY/virulence factor BrkB family protein n=1 Tax=Lacticaseibacillus pabuli TaxID=3025672 RepID=A0ABY7WTH1_9LACO|nr:YihY/virulence factor BrkB family protein [Lacticaseibacillus sp. KACC 23028]WDF83462.1 YihY/virulence factor BrkB family protein [Lacticaseibacillus sp. KACC 23028]